MFSNVQHSLSTCMLFCFSGYGGGFMERDVNPEYIKRDDSDDEYDEVGSTYLILMSWAHIKACNTLSCTVCAP